MYPYINIFGITVQSYHMMALAAGIAGIVLSAIYLRRCDQGIWSFILPFIVAVAAVIGARLLNYCTNPRAYTKGFKLWTPEYNKLSLMGGLVAGVAMIIIYCLLKKEKLAAIADAFVVPCAAGIILLKTGCFLNGCCFGKPTDGPFGVVFPANEAKYSFINSLKIVSAKSQVVHPTQLYEIVGALVAVAAAVILPRLLKMKEGSRAAIFAAIFAAARWIVLPLREFPYDKVMTEVIYPCLYAVIIICSLGYLIYTNKHGSKV